MTAKGDNSGLSLRRDSPHKKKDFSMTDNVPKTRIKTPAQLLEEYKPFLKKGVRPHAQHTYQPEIRTAAAEVTKSGTAAMTNSTEQIQELIRQRAVQREQEGSALLERATKLGILVDMHRLDMKKAAADATKPGVAHIRNDLASVEKTVRWQQLERQVEQLEGKQPKPSANALEKVLEITASGELKRPMRRDKRLEL
jgi:hypothetical protein